MTVVSVGDRGWGGGWGGGEVTHLPRKDKDQRETQRGRHAGRYRRCRRRARESSVRWSRSRHMHVQNTYNHHSAEIPSEACCLHSAPPLGSALSSDSPSPLSTLLLSPLVLSSVCSAPLRLHSCHPSPLLSSTRCLLPLPLKQQQLLCPGLLLHCYRQDYKDRD